LQSEGLKENFWELTELVVYACLSYCLGRAICLQLAIEFGWVILQDSPACFALNCDGGAAPFRGSNLLRLNLYLIAFVRIWAMFHKPILLEPISVE
jgi:hypothetical protein